MGTVTIDPSYRHMLGKLELLRDPYRSGDRGRPCTHAGAQPNL
jgi:hypothetical protein